MTTISRNINQLCVFAQKSLFSLTKERLFHASAPLSVNLFRDGTHNFLRYNKKIFPPQTENEKPRPAVS